MRRADGRRRRTRQGGPRATRAARSSRRDLLEAGGDGGLVAVALLGAGDAVDLHHEAVERCLHVDPAPTGVVAHVRPLPLVARCGARQRPSTSRTGRRRWWKATTSSATAHTVTTTAAVHDTAVTTGPHRC